MNSFSLSDWLQQWLAAGSEPVYRQLYRLLRQAILEGQIQPGARLPSSRSMARDVGIARNTVIQVYEQLAIEGYVSATTGKGTFVEDISQDSIEGVGAPVPSVDVGAGQTPGPNLSDRGQRLIGRLGFSKRQHGAFMAGLPDVAEFPLKVWLRIQNRQWRQADPRLLTYAPAGGFPPLRQAISGFLHSTRSVNSTAQQVVITTGIHQALDVATRLLCDIGDTVWIEDPSYWGLRNLLISSGLNVVPVAVDAEGIRPSMADRKNPPRLIVVTPSHQYPLGMVMSLARRRWLLQYARKHGCWILEDDYDSDFRFGSRPLPSLQGLDEAGRVLYVGSFSKTLYPGLRLGYMVVPEGLSEEFASAVAELYREGQLMTQSIVAEFVREGYLSSHIRRVRNLYAQRRALLIDAIRNSYGDQLEIVGDEAGLHLVLGLPDEVDDVQVCRDAFDRGILVRPLSDYYLDPARMRRGLLLGYAEVPPDEIKPAFRLLAGVIDDALAGIAGEGQQVADRHG